MQARLSSVAAPLAAVGIAAATVLLSPAVASAQEDTTTTFEITAGVLEISAQPTATLTSVAAGAETVSGSLGNVTVTDNRGSTLGWATTASSSAFTLAAESGDTTIEATAVDYAPGTVTTTGTITPTGTDAAGLAAAQTVVSGTAARGNNTATWNPTLTVTLPTDALAGVYTGIVSTSVA